MLWGWSSQDHCRLGVTVAPSRVRWGRPALIHQRHAVARPVLPDGVGTCVLGFGGDVADRGGIGADVVEQDLPVLWVVEADAALDAGQV
jgi:hypothetical protein